ncbi:riboflavin kinase [Paenarthrobacter sp. YIM B13468]|uniref:riboflavin kinase n=1 Tax=Paenarthrobacter sp. YIM B13468 TaxID=3366295 RepID=UPI0036711A9A
MNNPTSASLRGRVIDGEKRGRRLGFPTANIALDPDCRLPESGIYACRVALPSSRQVHDGTLSVGDNPTFGDIAESRIEVHLHDVTTNLYGERIEIWLVQRLRDMIRFETVADLILNTAQDVVRSREILSSTADDAQYSMDQNEPKRQQTVDPRSQRGYRPQGTGKERNP